MKILELSATELAKKIKAGEITSEEAAKGVPGTDREGRSEDPRIPHRG